MPRPGDDSRSDSIGRCSRIDDGDHRHARRVGGGAAPSTGRSGFEIYVDQGEDPDMGEIVVVKKKKSRLALNGMSWGALGEVTNVPASAREGRGDKENGKENGKGTTEGLLKVKGDENQKWWSIGRGRKDSKGKKEEKEKEKEQKPPARSKSACSSPIFSPHPLHD